MPLLRVKLARVMAALAVVTLLTTGCNTIRNILGYPGAGDPTVELKRAESKWLLIKNPRFGDVPSEPEYVWVEEEKMPTTWKSLVFGKSTLLAPPEVVAKYGLPPGGGRISPLQKVPYQEPTTAASGSKAAGVTAAAPPTTRTDVPAPVAPAPPPSRGYVVFVDTTRIVIDLNGQDGLKPGSVVSLRRDRIPIVHPITGELLGELDEEVATGKVIEVREKFSVVEIGNTAEAAEIKVRDRVVVR